MSLSSGSYIVSQATLVGLTGDCYCCCYILMQLFSAGNLNTPRTHKWVLPWLHIGEVFG